MLGDTLCGQPLLSIASMLPPLLDQGGRYKRGAVRHPNPSPSINHAAPSTTLGSPMAKSTPQENRRYVDMWALPGAHPSNVEFMQKLTTAESNQFTTHMDAVGTVSEQDNETDEWKRTHLVGLRTDVWHADKQELEQAVNAIKIQRRKQLKQQIKRNCLCTLQNLGVS